MKAIRSGVILARRILKQIGVEAGVDIEPEEQTALADATQALPGVLCAGVPGAGGMDAIFAVLLVPSAREAVESLWCSRSDPSLGKVVCPLGLREDRRQTVGFNAGGGDGSGELGLGGAGTLVGMFGGVRLESAMSWD